MKAQSTGFSRRYWQTLLAMAGVFMLAGSVAEAQPGGGRDRGMRPPWGEPGSILPEMRREEFLEELKFTDDQRKQLEDLRGEFNFRGLMRLGEDERKQKLKDYEAKVLNLLSADQKTIWEKRKAEILAKAAPVATPAGGTTGVPGTPPGAGGPPPGPAAPKRKIRADEPVPEGATPVASFDAAHDSTDGAPRLSFNFQYAPWPLVLEYFATKADLTLDLDDTPPGTFTYRDSHSYTPTQALDVLNGYLLPRGFLLVRRDRFLVCLSIADGIPPNLAPQISADELSERGKNELVSVVIPVRGLQAEQIVAEVRELLGPQGKASALKNTNSIVVTDIGSHVRRIYALISSESAVDTRDNAFKAIPLKHISATEAERMVRRLFGLTNVGGTSVPQAAGQPQPGQNGFGGGWGGWGGRRRDRDGRGEREEGDQPQQNQPPPNQPAPPVQTASSNSSPFANKVQVAADVRTNHLLVTASAALLLVVEDAVKTLDTDVDANGNPLRRVDVPLTFKIYTVPGGEIAAIAQTIDRMVPGVVLGQDPRLGKIHTQATPDEHKEIAALIEELGGEGSSSVAVIHLQKMDPVQLSNTLVNLYSKEGVRAPTVEADPLGRRLIVRGTPDQILQVKTILTQLGEGDGAARDKSDRGNVRSLTLGGRDPEELLPLLQDAWSATRPNPIRIKVPSRPKPIRDRAVPGADRRRDSDPLGDKPAPRAEFIRKAALESTEEEAAEPVENSDAAPDAKTSEQPKSDSEPISMQVVGDQLILSSSDPAALDRLEELYERVTAAIPARTKWNVFYLRSADATEAAQMVERLFPQSNVAASTSSSNSGMLGSLAGGFSSIGRGLMNVSGLNQTLSASQNLRIVTDIRSNALYVTGPADQVAEVEQILEVLDASELPGSLRDRIPRTITVEHADVEEVAAVVESVFKDQMTPENPMMGGGRGGSGGFNPLMMLMGGANSAPGGRRQPSVQLTVGIDKRTNHLIVSCNDQLFQQIEELVRGIDERAEKSRQTVRVVKLDQADPTLVQQTLGSLMTKVTVGATRRSRRPSTSSSSTSQGTSSPSETNPSPGGSDAQRDAFFQRMMMERAAGGGGFGGRRGFGGGDGPRGDNQRGGDRRRD